MKRTVQTLFFLFVAFFLVGSLTRNIFSYKDKVSFHAQLQAEHDEAQALNKQLKSDAQRSSDYYYIERQIREKLNLLQEDEVSIIIPEITPSPTPKPLITQAPYEMWIDLVVKK